mmetsp:Transcript_116837/g.342133  ORF Transcript_116837/g.342133 Transcript_116837/m.342133 type:complete len:346 (-) Transcript_116837:90-1127(-)
MAMASRWGLLFWPRGAPLLLVVLGNLSLATLISAVVLLLLPHGIVGKIRLLRRLRSRLLKGCKRAIELSKEGPFYRLFVWCGRRCAFGRLSSRCREALSVKARATGWSEAVLTWSPCLPMNPFHEENYVLAWRKAGSSDEKWRERQVNRHDDCEELAGSKLRSYMDGLPEKTLVAVRLCAVNVWGRGEWSEEVQVETLARPNEDGGFTGPLGPAGDNSRSYRWMQTASDIGLTLPIGPDRKARDIKFKALSSRLDIRCKVPEGESDELLVGPLHKRIKADEVTWEIEESAEHGRHLSVQLMKAEHMEKWPCLIEAAGHPRIDTRLVRLLGKGAGVAGLGGMDIFE